MLEHSFGSCSLTVKVHSTINQLEKKIFLTCIIDEALCPHFSKALFESVTLLPFTLPLDGSNNKEEKKLVPLTIWRCES